MAQYRVVEICAGAGGQSLGLELAGFGHDLSVELDANAAATFRHNRPHWKIAGKQLGANDERDLFAWAIELCATVRPRALMLENVRGLSMPRFSAYRRRVLDRRPRRCRAGVGMKASERCGVRVDVRFPVRRASSSSELSVRAGTGAWGTTRKHVRNDAGTRTSESVMCKFMGQPVVDIRIPRSRRLLTSGRHGQDAEPAC